MKYIVKDGKRIEIASFVKLSDGYYLCAPAEGGETILAREVHGERTLQERVEELEARLAKKTVIEDAVAPLLAKVLKCFKA